MPLIVTLADAVLTTGMTVAAGYPGVGHLGDRVLPFIPPVEVGAFAPNPGRRNRSRARLGVASGALVVGAVGNRNPQKGFESLIAAVGLLRRRGVDVRLVVRGSESHAHPGYAERLRDLAEAEGIRRDRNYGNTDDMTVPEVMAGFDVFVLSSVHRSEGIPTVIIEAMASGLPVVSTDVGAVREVLEDGVTGLVVADHRDETLAAAIAELLDSPSRRWEMGDAARHSAQRRAWTIETCADVHDRAYSLAASRVASRVASLTRRARS